jgi:hypothetical protein
VQTKGYGVCNGSVHSPDWKYFSFRTSTLRSPHEGKFLGMASRNSYPISGKTLVQIINPPLLHRQYGHEARPISQRHQNIRFTMYRVSQTGFLEEMRFFVHQFITKTN